MAAYASKAQALVQRGAEIARTIAPQVKASYTATMAKNAGAQLRGRATAGACVAWGDRGALACADRLRRVRGEGPCGGREAGQAVPVHQACQVRTRPRRGRRVSSSARRAGGWPKRAAWALPYVCTTLTAARPGPRCSIPSRYAHAQSELEAAKQVWARRSELQLSEVRAAEGWGVAPAGCVHCAVQCRAQRAAACARRRVFSRALC